MYPRSILRFSLAYLLQMQVAVVAEAEVVVVFVEVTSGVKMWRWLIVAFVVVGCGKFRQPSLDWPATVVAVENFSSQEEGIVLDAIDGLNTKAGRAILTDSPGGSPITIRWSKNIPQMANRGEVHVAGRATITSDDCTIEISSIVTHSSEKLIPVLWHEVGHCAGLVHDVADGEIMSTFTSPLDHYSPEALGRFFQSIVKSAGL